MIELAKLKELTDAIVSSDEMIKETIFCVDDAQAVNKLKDKKGVIMMVLYPEAEASGDQDASYDTNATWLYFLEKLKVGQKETEEFAQMVKLQKIALNARKFINDNFHKREFCYLRGYKQGSSSVIPEHNQFGGYNGWSISLVF